jgi:hypothetical protein
MRPLGSLLWKPAEASLPQALPERFLEFLRGTPKHVELETHRRGTEDTDVQSAHMVLSALSAASAVKSKAFRSRISSKPSLINPLRIPTSANPM